MCSDYWDTTVSAGHCFKVSISWMLHSLPGFVSRWAIPCTLKPIASYGEVYHFWVARHTLGQRMLWVFACSTQPLQLSLRWRRVLRRPRVLRWRRVLGRPCVLRWWRVLWWRRVLRWWRVQCICIRRKMTWTESGTEILWVRKDVSATWHNKKYILVFCFGSCYTNHLTPRIFRVLRFCLFVCFCMLTLWLLADGA